MDLFAKENQIKKDYKISYNKTSSSPTGQLRSSGYNEFSKACNIDPLGNDFLSKRLNRNNLMNNSFEYKKNEMTLLSKFKLFNENSIYNVRH